MNAMMRKTNDRHTPAGRAVCFVCVALVLAMVWSFFPVTALADFADTPLGTTTILKMDRSSTFQYKFSEYGVDKLPPEFGLVNHDFTDTSKGIEPSFEVHKDDVNFYYTEDSAGGKRAVYCFEPDNPWVDYNAANSFYNILPSIPDHPRNDEITQEQLDMLAYVMALGVQRYTNTANGDQVATQLAIWMVGAGHYKVMGSDSWLERLLPSTGTDASPNPGVAPNQAICDEARRLLAAALSCVQDRPSFVNTGVDLKMDYDGTDYTIALTDTNGKLTDTSEWGKAILAEFPTPDWVAAIDDESHTLTITGDPGGSGTDISVALGTTGKKGNIVFLDSPFTTSANDHIHFTSRQSMITINTLEPAVAGQFKLVRRTPNIFTSAKNADGTQIIKPQQNVTITDTVTYTDLNPGAEYTLTGVLMVNDGTAGGTTLLVNGNQVTASKIFEASDTGDESVDMTFTFDATGLDGKTLVVFENLFLNDISIATHEDIKDANQTIVVPAIATTAKNAATGRKTVTPRRTVRITDTVAYTNLTPGTEYTLTGVLMDKSTGNPVLVNGQEVTSTAIFTPTDANGTVEMTFTFDATALSGKILVVFEKLFLAEGDNSEPIVTHEDINDEGQSIRVVPDEPTGGDDGGDDEPTPTPRPTPTPTPTPGTPTPTVTPTTPDEPGSTVPGSAAVILGANKTYNNHLPSAGAFAFVLRDSSGTVIQTVRNDAAGNVTFSPQSFDSAGTYLFRITEQSTDIPVIIYDSAVFEAEVVVILGDNGYDAAVTYSRIDESGSSAVVKPEFANSSTPLEPGGPTEYVDIGDDGTPLGRWVPDEEIDEWVFIPEGEIPLGNIAVQEPSGTVSLILPKTGGNMPLILLSGLATLSFVILVALFARKKKVDN
jgi:Predicted solute binding protein